MLVTRTAWSYGHCTYGAERRGLHASDTALGIVDRGQNQLEWRELFVRHAFGLCTVAPVVALQTRCRLVEASQVRALHSFVSRRTIWTEELQDDQLIKSVLDSYFKLSEGTPRVLQESKSPFVQQSFIVSRDSCCSRSICSSLAHDVLLIDGGQLVGVVVLDLVDSVSTVVDMAS